LPAKLPRKQMVIERLLAIAAVGSELRQHFLFPEFFQISQRSRPARQLRPARDGQDQSRQFAQQMIVRRRAERSVPPRKPDVRWKDFAAKYAQPSFQSGLRSSQRKEFLVDFRFRISDFGFCDLCLTTSVVTDKQRINPCELNEPHSG